MLPSELDALIGKQTKSSNPIKSRPCVNSTSRQSELELIFQVEEFLFLIDFSLSFLSTFRNVHNGVNKI